MLFGRKSGRRGDADFASRHHDARERSAFRAYSDWNYRWSGADIGRNRGCGGYYRRSGPGAVLLNLSETIDPSVERVTASHDSADETSSSVVFSESASQLR